MKKFILLLLLFICVPFFLFSQSKRDQKKYDKIVILIKENQIELAKEETLKLLVKNKEWNKPHLLLASIYWLKEEFEKSEKEYFLFYNINSKKSASFIFQLARKFYEEGMYEKSIRYLYISESYLNPSLSADDLYKQKHTYYINSCRFAIDAMENPVEFKFENMGEKINTENAEYLPFISADGKEFIFTRLLETKDKKWQEDFYLSEQDNGVWNPSVPMDINTYLNEGSVTVSANGWFLIYTACNREDGNGSCDLYLCLKQENGRWSKAENISNINTRYWESQACFSPDLKYLYFVSNRRGGYGGDDIWRSEISRFGFLEPENLGPTINTIYNEMSPFLHPDNLTLYFASEGHIGMGGMDLFVSRRSNTDTLWRTPENLGYPINSYKTENSLVVESNGRTAYFVSDKSGFGKEDIFSFQLPEDKRAEPISDLEMDIIAKASGGEIILNNVFFETDSYQLIESSFTELNILLDYLNKNPLIKIYFEGHTDNIGGKEYNITLSENRAAEVLSYLFDRGIDKLRMTYKGQGDSSPIDTNKTELGRSKNRRTSFIIIK